MFKITEDQFSFDFTRKEGKKKLEDRVNNAQPKNISHESSTLGLKRNTSKYTEDYIKQYWSQDPNIFDVRDYESIGKPEWKDWLKDVTRETVTDMVKKRHFSNAGHSSYLIGIIIQEHGWTEEQIIDYVLSLREKHLQFLKEMWENDIVRAKQHQKEDLNYLKELYSYYLCCCNNLNEKPEAFENLIKKK